MFKHPCSDDTSPTRTFKIFARDDSVYVTYKIMLLSRKATLKKNKEHKVPLQSNSLNA